MPELPEVEVAARNLRRWAIGRKVRGVRADRRAARILRPAAAAGAGRARGGAVSGGRPARQEPAADAGQAQGGGRRVVGVWSHLGMTGKWLHRRAGEAAPRFARVRIDLDDGDQPALRGSAVVRPLSPGARTRASSRCPTSPALGPDPLNDGIDVDRLKRSARAHAAADQGGDPRPDAVARRSATSRRARGCSAPASIRGGRRARCRAPSWRGSRAGCSNRSATR